MKLFLYDITRLFGRRKAETPTGIDRVDLRYLLHIQKKYPKNIFYIFNHGNYLFLIDNKVIDLLILELDQRWNKNKDIDLLILETIEKPFVNIIHTKKKISPKQNKQKLAEDFSEIWTLRLENAKKIYHTKIKSSSIFTAVILSFLYILVSYPKQVFYYYKRKLTQQEHTKKNNADKIEFKISNKKTIEHLNTNLYDLLTEKKTEEIYYINISHQGIDNMLSYLDLYTGFSVKFVFYIHDIIPISFPEYVRDADKEKHMKRMDTVLSLGSSLILTNSEDSKVKILKYTVESGKFLNFSADRIVPMTIGVENQIQIFDEEQSHVFESLKNSAYFVVIGTIEPRKNHLLLLNLWREFVKKFDHNKIPKLIIVGKRGWENENIVDMLDRCDSLKGYVHEMSNLSDKELFAILKDSKALLFPSFVEGWGMPLVEAMTLNVPVICSDIPVFKEAGQNLAEYVSPINGEKWGDVILDFTQENSQLRADQLERLKNFKIPQWDDHFNKFDSLLNKSITK